MKVRASRVGPAAIYATAVVGTLAEGDKPHPFLYLGIALVLVVAVVFVLERYVLDRRHERDR
jgi:drug/metabolite transporter (DMT)-like permease